MAWINKRAAVDEQGTSIAIQMWNALSDAISDLEEDIRYLPEDVADARFAHIQKLKDAIEAGKPLVMPGAYKTASKEEDR